MEASSRLHSCIGRRFLRTSLRKLLKLVLGRRTPVTFGKVTTFISCKVILLHLMSIVLRVDFGGEGVSRSVRYLVLRYVSSLLTTMENNHEAVFSRRRF
jgi:hypothetical protein